MGDLIFGLKLTLIGMGSVFALLTIITLIVKLVEKFYGPEKSD